ncbi:hypothetical protein WJX84_004580 [Apatococcus fuscideae]|uniref:Uncharacterized protein n=1 Tax=Apatococcus fuscideae TaxID=2026836 RepID=A0AAW1SJD4_9CHLO
MDNAQNEQFRLSRQGSLSLTGAWIYEENAAMGGDGNGNKKHGHTALKQWDLGHYASHATQVAKKTLHMPRAVASGSRPEWPSP